MWFKQLEHAVDHDSSMMAKRLFQPSWNTLVKMVHLTKQVQKSNNQSYFLGGDSLRSAGLGIS